MNKTSRGAPSRLDSLLAFLEQCGDDGCNDGSFSGGREAGGGVHSTSCGLCDITNEKPHVGSGEEKAKLKDRTNHPDDPKKPNPFVTTTALPRVREKKYVWEKEWDDLLQEDPSDDEEVPAHREKPDAPPGERLPEKNTPPGERLPVNARKQLQELKALSAEIQTKATALRIELEHKTNKVEQLHSLRVKSEADHVQKVKAVKRDWKERHNTAQEEHEKAISTQRIAEQSLAKDCEALGKKVASVQAELTRIAESETETCERLRNEGSRTLEEARRSWQQAEKDELKKRDTKMSPKLKKDAAKAIEPKLKRLMENNKEELDRLEREAARELETYKLQLYRQSNEEYRRETSRIRSEERERASKMENDWMGKLESSRFEHEEEVKNLKEEHEKRSVMLKHQFEAERRICIDEHQALLDECNRSRDLAVEQARAQHKREMNALEEAHSLEITQRRRSGEEEFEKWKITRGHELECEEDAKLKEEHSKMKSKYQSDVELVRHRLQEEKNEKTKKYKHENDAKNAAIEKKHNRETKRLEGLLEQARNATVVLEQSESEETSAVHELQEKLAHLKETLADKEDEVVAKERKLDALVEEGGIQVTDAEEEGKRIVARLSGEKSALDQELDKLIADLPKQRDDWRQECDSLKASNAEELALAEQKVKEILRGKNELIDRASSKLLKLRRECAKMEEEVDDARRTNVLGKAGAPGRQGKAGNKTT